MGGSPERGAVWGIGRGTFRPSGGELCSAAGLRGVRPWHRTQRLWGPLGGVTPAVPRTWGGGGGGTASGAGVTAAMTESEPAGRERGEQVQGDPRVSVLLGGSRWEGERGAGGGAAADVADKGRTRSRGWKSELDKSNLEISQQPEP